MLGLYIYFKIQRFLTLYNYNTNIYLFIVIRILII